MTADPPYRHPLAWALAAALFLAAAAAGAQLHGRLSRVRAARQPAAAVASPEEATARWQALGLRGRTLLLFDRYPRALAVREPPSARLVTASHFVQAAILSGVVRRVYLVVRDDEWPDFLAQGALHRALRRAPGLAAGVELYTFSGAPLVALPSAALPRLDEEVLVYVDARVYEPGFVGRLLEERRLVSDVPLVMTGGGG